MFTIKKILILSLALLQNANTSAFTFPNHITNNIATRTAGNSQHHAGIKSRFFSSNNDSDSEPVPSPQPINFREAEVLGLRLMQEGQHEEALKGTYTLYVERKEREIAGCIRACVRLFRVDPFRLLNAMQCVF